MIQIFTLARPRIDLAAIKAFLRIEDAKWRRTKRASPAEEIVEVAGRVCYMSFGKRQSPRTNQEFVRNLIAQGHESVLEHVSWTFAMTGVSRAFTHQLVRHRVGFSFSQLSQQYHDESHASFVEPEGIAEFPEIKAAWLHAVESSREAYKKILKSLRAHETQSNLTKREQLRNIRSSARSVLPNATKTTIVVTANARALRHFLSVRGSIVGDSEMRIVSAAILREVRMDTTSLFADFSFKKLADGLPIVVQEVLIPQSLYLDSKAQANK